MVDNGIDFGDFDDVFGAASAAVEDTDSAQLAQEQLEQSLESFEKKFIEAKNVLEENPIHKIVTSGKTGAEAQQEIIDYATVEIGEDSEAVVAQLSQIVAQYASLSAMTSETVRKSGNLEEGAVFDDTALRIAEKQETYSEKANVFYTAIEAMYQIQADNKNIKDVIREINNARSKFTALKNSMLLQSETVEDAQTEYDRLIAKQKGLQAKVDVAMQTKDGYTNGCEEVKNEQGEVTKKKRPALKDIKAAHAAEKGGFFGFGGGRKQELADFIKACEDKIKAADEELDDTNIQVKNLEPQIQRAGDALKEAKAKLEEQKSEHDAIDEKLKSDASYLAIEEILGEDGKNFKDSANAFQQSGTDLIDLMSEDFSKCVVFYSEKQKSIGKLINVGGNLTSELELIVSSLNIAETAHKKRFDTLCSKLDTALAKIEEEKQQAISDAQENIENEEEKGARLAEIEREYMDNPPLIQKMVNDKAANQNFLRRFSARLEQIVSFKQQAMIALKKSEHGLAKAENLAYKAESLKNEHIMIISNGTSNCTDSIDLAMKNLRMSLMEEFGAAMNRDNAKQFKQSVEGMLHEKRQELKNGQKEILSLREMSQCIDETSKKLRNAAVHGVAIKRGRTKAIDGVVTSAQNLALTEERGEADVLEKMATDSEYAKKVEQVEASMLKPTTPKTPTAP